MSFREIIAELPNLTEDEKRELLGLLVQQPSQPEESPQFLAMLKARIDAASVWLTRFSVHLLLTPQGREDLAYAR